MRWLGILLFPFSMMLAQDPYAPQERMRFAQVSFETGHYTEALEESRQLLAIAGLNHDSLHYIAARSAYLLHLRDTALHHFALITHSTPSVARWADAVIGWESFGLQDSAQLSHRMDGLASRQDRFADFGALLQMAELLHHADTAAYRQRRAETPVHDLYVRQALKEMDLEVKTFGEHRHKSPAAAGLLSAGLPGAGKCYLGRWGSGTISLLGHAALGVQAWEGYRRDGLRSPQFIAMGSLLLLSYSANIYGTVIQTKAYNVKLVTDLRQGVGVQVDLAFDRLLH